MRKILVAFVALPLLSAAAPAEDYDEPYRILEQANRALDASLAASAYATDGALIFETPGRQTEVFRGTEAIRDAYVRTFAQVDVGTPIKLDFRFARPGPGADPHSGAYRARLKKRAAATSPSTAAS